MANTMQGVRSRVRHDECACDLSDVFSLALSVSETAGRYALHCDEYDGGWYDGDTVNDDMLDGEWRG